MAAFPMPKLLRVVAAMRWLGHSVQEHGEQKWDAAKRLILRTKHYREAFANSTCI